MAVDTAVRRGRVAKNAAQARAEAERDLKYLEVLEEEPPRRNRGRPRNTRYTRVYNEIVSLPRGTWVRYTTGLANEKAIHNIYQAMLNRTRKDGLKVAYRTTEIDAKLYISLCVTNA